MRSRWFSVRKSTWLIISIIINSFIFIFGSALSAGIFHEYNLWFFIFCFCIGSHLIFKSFLFKYDSACYFGVILFLVGLFYPYTIILDIKYLYPVFIMLAFSFASVFTFYFYKQPYQLFLAFSLFFVAIGLLLYLINVISIAIFLAFVAVGVLLLIIRFFTLK